MKWIGVALLFLAALCGYVQHQRSNTQTLHLLREIMDDLLMLRCGICVQRCSLPTVLRESLCHGLSGYYLWCPLLETLSAASGTFEVCWERVLTGLPSSIARCLVPLGRLIPFGGEELSNAIDAAREEVLLLVREHQEKQVAGAKLSAAVCFCSAALLSLVLI